MSTTFLGYIIKYCNYIIGSNWELKYFRNGIISNKIYIWGSIRGGGETTITGWRPLEILKEKIYMAKTVETNSWFYSEIFNAKNNHIPYSAPPWNTQVAPVISQVVYMPILEGNRITVYSSLYAAVWLIVYRVTQPILWWDGGEEVYVTSLRTIKLKCIRL